MKITVIGYGIQGRAQALNLRDSGNDVVIVNRDDSYLSLALNDGFKVLTLKEGLQYSDVIFLLIPDGVQDEILKSQIFPQIRSSTTLVFAHGYWLTYQAKYIPENIDVLMMAPRFPGEQIRRTFLNESGVPAYVDIVQDFSKNAQNTLEKLSKDLGYMAGGVIPLSYKQETEIDLFIEQFMAPTFFASVETAFKLLLDKGYPEEAICLELYYSGELGAVRTMMGRDGLYKGFQNNASPTCQYGVASARRTLWSDEMADKASSALERITSGQFSKELSDHEACKHVLKSFVSSEIAGKIKSAERNVDKKIKKSL